MYTTSGRSNRTSKKRQANRTAKTASHLNERIVQNQLCPLPNELHSIIGNQATLSLISGIGIQPKLEIGPPNDIYESEANRVSAQIIGMSEPAVQRQAIDDELVQTSRTSERSRDVIQRQTQSQSPESLDTSPEGEELDGTVLLSRQGSSKVSSGADLSTGISQAKGGGNPLSSQAQAYMGSRFGYNFGNVRVHTDNRADHLNRQIGASAFTLGNDIFFRSGRYDTHGHGGRKLLAHELTHVVQQNGGNKNDPGTTVQRSQFDVPTISRFRKKIQRQVEVHVNLRGRDRVRVYRKGKKTIMYVASGGKKSTPTKLGTFSIAKRKHATKKLGKWGLQYFAVFNGGQGFHSTNAYPKRATLCRDGSGSYCKPKSKLQKRVHIKLTADGGARSHGCVRLNPSDAKALFKMVKDGTKVRIYERKVWLTPTWSTIKKKSP